MGINESMPQEIDFVHYDTEREHNERQANKPKIQNNMQKSSQESKTTEPDDLCEFPQIISVTPGSNAAVENMECESPHTDEHTRFFDDRKIKPNSPSRRYSDLCIGSRLTTARRRTSTPIFRTVNQADDNLNENSESKLPENTPCRPDLNTCCQNVATFLANAAATSTTNSDSPRNAPSAEYIYSYMRLLFALMQIEPECCVYADIYLRRLLSNAQGTVHIHSGNWHKILVGACLLASKYVDDLSMGNRDFSTALTGCSLEFMNKLECKYVQLLQWKLHVPISEYTTRYFELASKQDSARDWDINFEIVKPHFTAEIVH